MKDEQGRVYHKNFYPRPPRGGRHHIILRRIRRFLISIHALREEGDVPYSTANKAAVVFLSTPSARRATFDRTMIPAGKSISIHALREEGDRPGGFR